MKPQIKNIIIFVSVLIILFVLYSAIFGGKKEEQSNLESTNSKNTVVNDGTLNQSDLEIARDFLSLLLSIKSLELNDKIFSDIAFTSLRDTSVPLIHDGSEGRPNPFAPIGTENESLPAQSINTPNPNLGNQQNNDFIINPFANQLTQ